MNITEQELMKNLDECPYYLFNDDNIAIMKRLPENCIDLTVTSPPYDNMRCYEGTLQWNEKVFKQVANELYRITKQGGTVVWVVSDQTKNGSESGTSFKQALYFKEIGFNLHDTMIWNKCGAGAVGSNYSYWQNFEFMFVFTKGKINTFNPIEDRKNIISPKIMKTTAGCDTNGIRGTRTIQSKEYGRRFNIWTIPTETNSEHPAPFPEILAQDHILSWSNEGDIIFDPFLGSGTTGAMAIRNNRKFIGIDKVEKYFNMSKERIGKEW